MVDEMLCRAIVNGVDVEVDSLTRLERQLSLVSPAGETGVSQESRLQERQESQEMLHESAFECAPIRRRVRTHESCLDLAGARYTGKSRIIHVVIHKALLTSRHLQADGPST